LVGADAFARENGTAYHTYTVTARDPFVAPYYSFLLERTPKAQPAEPRSGGRTSTRNDGGRALQLPLRQLAEGLGNGAAGGEGDRGVADGFPAETVGAKRSMALSWSTRSFEPMRAIGGSGVFVSGSVG
jgi:hypothetical protein